MQTYYHIRILTVVLVLAVAACSAPQKLQVAETIGDNSLASAVAGEFNRYRVQQGTKPLARHRGLDKLAASHSRYMMEHRGSFTLHGRNVSHMGAEGRSLVAIRHYNFTSTSENVAASPRSGDDRSTASKLVRLWKNSPDHDYAMKNKAWTHTGIGIAVAPDGMVFATQLFGTIGNFQRTNIDRFNSF